MNTTALKGMDKGHQPRYFVTQRGSVDGGEIPESADTRLRGLVIVGPEDKVVGRLQFVVKEGGGRDAPAAAPADAGGRKPPGTGTEGKGVAGGALKP